MKDDISGWIVFMFLAWVVPLYVWNIHLEHRLDIICKQVNCEEVVKP